MFQLINMKQTRYPFDRTVAITGFLLLSVASISAIVGHGDFRITDPIIILFIGFPLFVLVTSTYGTYADLDETRRVLSRTNGFVDKKILKLNEIKELKYQPTWKVGSSNRSLYVIGVHNGLQKIIDFPNLGFSEKTIAQIARDLKAVIPALRTDPETEALIEKYYKLL